MLFDIQNDPYYLSAVENHDRMLRSIFFCDMQMPGGRDTINCQVLGQGTHRVSNVRSLPGGCSRMELARTFLTIL